MRSRAIQARFQVLLPNSQLKHPAKIPYYSHHRRHFTLKTTMSSQPDYTTWDTNSLIARITSLEEQLRSHNLAFSSLRTPSNLSSSPTPNPSAIAPQLSSNKPRRAAKPFNPTKYTTRLIALKFAYLGSGYNGFEHHVGNSTPLPTIEEELWKSLVKCRLIFPPSLEKWGLLEGNVGEKLERMSREEISGVAGDWEGCEYSKCGRTDRGVSAFGQVVGVKVRSARLARREKTEVDVMNGAGEQEDGIEVMNGVNGEDLEVEAEKMSQKEDTFDPIKDELPYIALLNRVLPPTIRILAWCPSPPPNFSARFSCKERVYKYFFTNPAYLPFPSTSPPNQTLKEGYISIAAMREAGAYLEGTHDFRNFCKVDATKQITNFKRRITQASIECLPTPAYLAQHSKSSDFCPPQPNTYTFTVRGSAFLWHQVRCMVAVLFLVGQGLEKPEIVKELLDVERNPRRPQYEMASDNPLVLWECTFSVSAQGRYVEANGAAERDDEVVEDSSRFWDRGLGDDEFEWVYADGENKWGRMGLMEDLWRGWRAAKMDEVLAGQLLDLVSSQGAPPAQSVGRTEAEKSTRVFQGDDAAKPVGRYVPVMQKERMDPVEAINAKYLVRRDARRSAATGVNEGDANE